MSRLVALVACFSVLLLSQPAEPGPPALRLPGDVVPVEYTAELQIKPGQDRFDGRIVIDVEVKKPASTLWLLSRDLSVNSATLGGERAEVRSGSYDFIGLRTNKTLPVGRTRVEIEYTGVVSRVLTDGVFQQQEQGDWYVFTKFEPVTARRAFPSFDEPSFKTPWRLTLRFPAGLRGYSNTPTVRNEPAEDGMRVVEFARTKPLPTYLVAFAIGPFEEVETAAVGKRKIPSRIVVPKGRAAEAALASAITPKAVELLEEYFGIPYPYEKLDQVVVPLTTAWGAMENAGLIAYGQFLLMKPGQKSVSREQSVHSVVLHELAHQWFGNLVTMPWWDDIWLNEGFASWVGQKMLARWRPEWGVNEDLVGGYNRAKAADVLLASRRVRQPIRTPGDIGLAFDGMTYVKGSALLQMYENAIGPAMFRAGVRAHLDSRAWGNGSTQDLLASIGSAARHEVANSFSSFLDQRGLPLIQANVRCERGKATLELVQQPFTTLGQEGQGRRELWDMPVCVRWNNGRQCVQLAKQTDTFALQAKGCPEWLYPNENGAGYYRVLLDPTWTERLLQRSADLTGPEPIAFLRDADALMTSGKFDAGQALRVSRAFSDSNSPRVTGAAVSIAGRVARFAPPESKAKLQALFRDWFGGRARELGWEPQAGESEDRRRLRQILVPFVAEEGADPQLAGAARAQAERFLSSRSSVDRDAGVRALLASARSADRPFFERLVTALRAGPAQDQRAELILALGSVRDPALAGAALNLILAPHSGADRRELARLLAPGPWEITGVIWSYIKVNFDRLNGELPGARGIPFGSTLPLALTGFCETRHAEEVEAFFRPKAAANPGMERNLDRATESIRLCAAQKQALEPGLRAFVEGVRPGHAIQEVRTQE
ncbi:MAG TPA: M1 family metallopeptidase [Bryobacteraceae bacterium]|nr:M1 family metallopeptidase [Bryobacteraceae bacterium]